MFRGECSLTVDVKGRLAVPARYRERLAETCSGRMVITISVMERCLVVYPFPQWQRIERSLDELPAFDAEAQAINHLLIGHAAECDLDRHGRMLLPQSLREFASIDKRVKMVGLVRKFELWDESAWAARREEYLGQIGRLPGTQTDALRGLVL
jgi:MraZ protein